MLRRKCSGLSSKNPNGESNMPITNPVKKNIYQTGYKKAAQTANVAILNSAEIQQTDLAESNVDDGNQTVDSVISVFQFENEPTTLQPFEIEADMEDGVIADFTYSDESLVPQTFEIESDVEDGVIADFTYSDESLVPQTFEVEGDMENGVIADFAYS